MSMIDMLPPSFPLLCPPIHKTLCLRIHAIIDPLYRWYGGCDHIHIHWSNNIHCCTHYHSYMPKAVRSSPLPPPPGVDQCLVYTDLTRSCFELLCRLGPQLHLDPILLVKFLRITRPFVKEYFATLNGNGQVSTEMVSALCVSCMCVCACVRACVRVWFIAHPLPPVSPILHRRMLCTVVLSVL